MPSSSHILSNAFVGPRDRIATSSRELVLARAESLYDAARMMFRSVRYLNTDRQGIEPGGAVDKRERGPLGWDTRWQTNGNEGLV